MVVFGGCSCGGVLVEVFLWWCFCGGVFVVLVVVFMWWCFCGGVPPVCLTLSTPQLCSNTDEWSL